MGEKIVPPKENQDKQAYDLSEMLNGISENPTEGEDNVNSNSGNGGDGEEEQDDIDIYEGMSPEEFAALDNQLDALNSALDDIEQKNDSIHAQLVQLLTANREIRQQLQQANSENTNDGSDQNQAKEPKQ
ncbi:unnamed protein product [Phyllotreta striolata]|uniref:Uncharacterized protein n=1 Tax=Phyllotreta striolata TaxID=444603 RepID=A0A9N9XQH9_PHYSR|nr:unnamed protein product [Phyllotreta striolata]